MDDILLNYISNLLEVILVFANISEQFDDLVFKLVDNGFGSVFVWGIFFIVLGLLFIIVSICLNVKSKSKSDNLLNNAIAQDNETLGNNINNELVDNKLVNNETFANEEIISDIEKVIIDEDILVNDVKDVVSVIKEDEIPVVKIESNLVNEEGIDDISVDVMIDADFSKTNEIGVNVNEISEVEFDEEEQSNSTVEEVKVTFDNEIPKVDIISDVTLNEVDDDIKSVDIFEDDSDGEDLINIQEIELVDVLENEEEIPKIEAQDNEFVEIADDEDESGELIREFGVYNKNNFEEIEDAPEIVVNTDIDVIFPDEVEVSIAHPVKGKDVVVDLKEEEEIEFL